MKRLCALVGMAAMLVGVTACGGPTPGQPTPATTTGGSSLSSGVNPSGGSSVTSSEPDALPVDQPCSLYSSSDLEQLGASSPPSQDMVGTAHSCELSTSNGHIGLDIRTDAGISAFTPVPTGDPVTDTPIGKHQAKQQDVPKELTCFVILSVNSTSRVDVSTTGNGTADPCPTAVKAATLVEPKLP